MTLFFPLLYLLAGWLIGRTTLDIKAFVSAFLTKLIIPFVIIFNIATHFRSMGEIIIVTVIVMLVLLGVSRFIVRDPVKNICFCYLNIGWLGLPVASSLFGNDAAVIIIAAYIGSSIVGNSVGAGILSANGLNMRKIATMPPVIALISGLLLLPFGDQVTVYFSAVYEVSKFLMSFLGMAILGIWLSQVKVTASDFRHELLPFFVRAATLFVLISALLWLSHLTGRTIIASNPAALYLLCLLPPAANIIVLETHYLGTGRSARSISCGTCISIVAIAIYAAVIVIARSL